MHRTRRKVWALALLGSLFVHLVVVIAVRALHMLDPVVVPPAPEPEIVQLTFLPPERPPQFTELPPDRADEPPEESNLLSNVDSRARDRAEGGSEADLPRLDGTSDFPQVAMTPGAAPSPPPAVEESEPVPDAETESEEVVDSGEGTTSSPTPPTKSLLSAILRERAAASEPRPEPERPGDSDLPQVEMQRPQGNARLSGDISLSTTAWEYAPWLQDFRRRVQAHWRAPIAYHYGLIHGWTVFQVEIARDGRILGIGPLESQVTHESLETSARFALEGSAPYLPLPSHFPDETLILQIRFMYPNLRP